MPSFKGAMGSIHQIMVGYLQYREAVLEVESSIIEGSILGPRSVKEGELLFIWLTA